MPQWLSIFRLAALGFATLCGIIVASISARITAFTEDNFEVYYRYSALGIATGALTMLSLPVLLIVDFLRTGAFTSYVLVELVWLSILWVLWLATAALAVSDTTAAGVFTSCDYIYDWVNALCHETQAIEAFSFLAWIALMAYTAVLLALALLAARRGKPIWTSSVKQYAAASAAASVAYPPSGATPAQPSYSQNVFAPQTMAQQQPLMAPASMSPPPVHQGLPHAQPGQGYAPQQHQGQQGPYAPTASPASVPSYPQV